MTKELVAGADTPDKCPGCVVHGEWWDANAPWRCLVCGHEWTDRRDFYKAACPHPDCPGSYKDPWFDRTIMMDGSEEVEGMGYVCHKCGRRV